MGFIQIFSVESPWFASSADLTVVADADLRVARGRGHQSKTLMLQELPVVVAEPISGSLAAVAEVHDRSPTDNEKDFIGRHQPAAIDRVGHW